MFPTHAASASGERSINQIPVTTSATAIGAQPYCSGALYSGKMRDPKQITGTRSELKIPKIDSAFGMIVDFEKRQKKSVEPMPKKSALMLYDALPSPRAKPTMDSGPAR